MLIHCRAASVSRKKPTDKSNRKPHIRHLGALWFSPRAPTELPPLEQSSQKDAGPWLTLNPAEFAWVSPWNVVRGGFEKRRNVCLRRYDGYVMFKNPYGTVRWNSYDSIWWYRECVGWFWEQSFVEFEVESIISFKLSLFTVNAHAQAGVQGWPNYSRRLDQWVQDLKTMRLVFTYLPAW